MTDNNSLDLGLMTGLLFCNLSDAGATIDLGDEIWWAEKVQMNSSPMLGWKIATPNDNQIVVVVSEPLA